MNRNVQEVATIVQSIEEVKESTECKSKLMITKNINDKKCFNRRNYKQKQSII